MFWGQASSDKDDFHFIWSKIQANSIAFWAGEAVYRENSFPCHSVQSESGMFQEAVQMDHHDMGSMLSNFVILSFINYSVEEFDRFLLSASPSSSTCFLQPLNCSGPTFSSPLGNIELTQSHLSSRQEQGDRDFQTCHWEQKHLPVYCCFSQYPL